MNNTKIEWCNKTINPVVGCTNGCAYCYARRQAKRQKHRCKNCYEFKPHAHLERLEQITPRQKPQIIFIDSMWDWNCPDNEIEWMLAIIKKMEECSQHTFLILSKHPRGYKRFKFPPNVWLGTTITCQEDVWRLTDLSIANTRENKTFVSVEPLKNSLLADFGGVNWVIIGAETGHTKDKVVPDEAWIEFIMKQARPKPIFLKNNLNWPEQIQEFPVQREGAGA